MGTPGYNRVARWLHWLVAALIVIQYVLADMAENAGLQGQVLAQLAVLAQHKSIGMTVLVLAVIRLGWRLKHPSPTLPEAMPAWQITLSHISHWSLYLLILLVPVSGWLMSSASAYSVSWFNLFTFPDLVRPDETLKELLTLMHEVLAGLLFVIALLHILAAFKHAVFDRDGIMSGMLSTMALILSGLIASILVWFAVPSGTTTSDRDTTAESSPSAAPSSDKAAEIVPTDTSLTPWQIDYEKSYIKFSAEQAGAPFDGIWEAWTAQIRFDPNELERSNATVDISVGQVTTQDTDRDSTITGSEFFDAQTHPSAFYRVADFSQLDTGYVANGELEIKGISLPVPLNFSVTYTPDTIKLTGDALIDRLLFNIGTGDWADTTWVGQQVTVEVVVTASPSSQ